MEIDKTFLKAYKEARDYVDTIFGQTPENYKIMMFVDPSLYDSVLLQTRKAGSPNAVISSNELEILDSLKEDGFVPRGIDLFFGTRSPKLYIPDFLLSQDPTGGVAKAKLIQFFAKALIVEQSASSFPDVLASLHRRDTIISNLFTNNVFEFVKERNAPWVWQYFQDFTATLRMLSIYKLDDFYLPPTSVRDTSIFYNYLLEIKNVIQERAKDVLKAPLMDLVVQGFGELVLDEYLDKQDKLVRQSLEPMLKSNLGQPLGIIGKTFLENHAEGSSDIFEVAKNFENDQQLTSIWNRGDTKKHLGEVRNNLGDRSIVWHQSRNSYWSDLWPLRASAFDRVGAYVGKIQRRKYKSFSELLDDNPLVTEHGRVQLRDREVAVLSIQEDTIGQEQLLILRNHLEARKDTFITPLPGLPDIIVFKKYAGMHVASYLGVADKESQRKYPKSPYDLPLVVRAVQVRRGQNVYTSDEREDTGKIETANYENVSRLTQPQHQAIRYLIRQGEVLQ